MRQDTARNLKIFAIAIFIPLAIGGLSAFLTRDNMQIYSEVQTPPLSPPAILFPIVWTILYVLMGISSYLIYEKDDSTNKKALTLYAIQLALNFIWPIFFFGFNAYLFSFILIIILWIVVLLTIIEFYKTSKLSGLIMIPYLLWLTFAAYLNLGVYLLN